ncbi:HPr family phosphocarrier protein [Rhodothalassium salexigens]|uniref:HPr family phosphocarrier protein n=1 Tax=Rhodothalassium salexigens TaxID=1086 RepID=UPI0019128D19|nr:HPr family phosphocarrier protein [Rhodothalassium salexigens]MBK5921570.1 HPr family phosphocarrier protein [Rhodothalassium salexigens]
MTDRCVTLCNERGLHARASAKFVRLAGEFDAEVIVDKAGQSVVGTSIMGLMLLAAACGEAIRIRAEGPEAEAAVAALADLVGRGFDE